MKLLAKSLVVVLIIGLLLPFTLLKGPDGRPLMSLDKLRMPDLDLPGLPAQQRPGGGLKSPDGHDLIFKWLDADGTVQFSTSPPPDGVAYTVKAYDPDTNLIQAVEVPVDAPEESEDAAQPAKSQGEEQARQGDESANPYSPDRIKKLFDDAENVEKLLNERLKRQEAEIGQ